MELLAQSLTAQGLLVSSRKTGSVLAAYIDPTSTEAVVGIISPDTDDCWRVYRTNSTAVMPLPGTQTHVLNDCQVSCGSAGDSLCHASASSLTLPSLRAWLAAACLLACPTACLRPQFRSSGRLAALLSASEKSTLMPDPFTGVLKAATRSSCGSIDVTAFSDLHHITEYVRTR